MGTNKTLNIISTFVGKIVSCEVTVAEPDGSDGVAKTAVYNKVIEVAGTIDTPEVLAPADGAGSGDARYLISDTIIDVEGGGVETCETDTIESVLEVSGRGPGTGDFDVTQDMANVGLKSIAGIRILKRGDTTLTTELAYLKIDGVDATSSSVTITAGSPYAGVPGSHVYDYENFFVTRPAFDTVRAQGDNSPEYSCLIDPPIDVQGKTITFGILGSTPQDGAIYLIDEDGREVPIYVDGYATLTFPTSNNFDCFEPGDVVQNEVYQNDWSSYLTIPSGATWGNSNYPDSTNLEAFDGDTTTLAVVKKGSSAQQLFTFTFPDTLTGSNDIKVYVRRAGSNTTALIAELYGPDDSLIDSNSMPPPGNDIAVHAFTNVTNVKYIIVKDTHPDTANISGIELNGMLLIDNSFDTEQVKIISKDEDANTITVDGGKWLAEHFEIGSAVVTGTPVNANTLWDNAFDGVTHPSDYFESTYMAASSNFYQAIFDNAIPIPGGATVTVEYIREDTNSNIYIIHDGGQESDVTSMFPVTATNVAGSVDIPQSNIGSNIEGIKIEASLAPWIGVSGIYINGKIILLENNFEGDDKLVKETPYNTKLTVDGSKDLADMTGATFMSAGIGAPGPYSKRPTSWSPLILKVLRQRCTKELGRLDEVVNTDVSDTWEGYNPINLFNAASEEGYWLGVRNQVKPGEVGSVSYTNNGKGFPAGDSPLLECDWRIKLPLQKSQVSIRRSTPVLYAALGGLDMPNGTVTFTGSFTKITFSAEGGDGCHSPGTSNSNANLQIKNFTHNGVRLVDGTPATGGFLLTFPGDVSTNPDLRYFAPGDLVQGAPSGIYALTAMDGDSATFAKKQKVVDTYKLLLLLVQLRLGKFTFATAKLPSVTTGPVTVQAEISDRAGTNWDDITNAIYTDAGDTTWTEVSRRPEPDSNFVTVEFTVPVGASYFATGANINNSKNESLASIVSVVWNGVKVPNYLLAGQGGDPVYVISTGYPDSNTMVVDGGEWEGFNSDTNSSQL